MKIRCSQTFSCAGHLHKTFSFSDVVGQVRITWRLHSVYTAPKSNTCKNKKSNHMYNVTVQLLKIQFKKHTNNKKSYFDN